MDLNTTTIINQLAQRQQLLMRLLKIESNANLLDIDHFTTSSNTQDNSLGLLDNSLGLLSVLSANVIGSNSEASKLNSIELSNHAKSTQALLKLEECLCKMREQNLKDMEINKLPSLILPTAINTSHDSNVANASNNKANTTTPAIGSSLTRMNRNRQSITSYQNSNGDMLSNAATTVDLSEDEQINYYEDEYEDEVNEGSQEGLLSVSGQLKTSTGSDRTIVTMPSNSLYLNKSSDLNKSNNSDADDEEDGQANKISHLRNSTNNYEELSDEEGQVDEDDDIEHDEIEDYDEEDDDEIDDDEEEPVEHNNEPVYELDKTDSAKSFPKNVSFK